MEHYPGLTPDAFYRLTFAEYSALVRRIEAVRKATEQALKPKGKRRR
ncbi:hypothetical protein LCGC14_2218490 [marine sediment metagenome]|uniref:Uncharacterized protein n=1 Tax=marine sediment metagenome TaxID=412755 RepID=A0A0F9DBN7_9ZZZZ